MVVSGKDGEKPTHEPSSSIIVNVYHPIEPKAKFPWVEAIKSQARDMPRCRRPSCVWKRPRHGWSWIICRIRETPGRGKCDAML